MQSLLAKLPRGGGGFNTDRSQKVNEIDAKLVRCKTIKKSFKMECRLIKDNITRRAHEDKLSSYEVRITALEGELKWAKTEGDKAAVFSGAKGGGDPEKDGDAMLKEADRLQDKTAQSLAHTAQLVAASKEVGAATIEELHRQREQIKDITEEVMQIEDNLTRADKLIKSFGRRMMTDKFIQCFACINVCLLAGVIAYAVVQKNKGAISSAKSKLPDTPFRRLLQSFLIDFGGDDDDEYFAGSATYEGTLGTNRYADHAGPGV